MSHFPDDHSNGSKPTANPSRAPIYSNYLVSIPVNVNGTIKGVELNYIQPIGDNFGVQLNYTYVDSNIQYVNSSGANVLKTAWTGMSTRLGPASGAVLSCLCR